MGSIFFTVIASGSQGNSTLIHDEDTYTLIDFGISFRRYKSRFQEEKFFPSSLNLFITHEHSDHASGIQVLSRQLPVDIYSRKKTLISLGLDESYSISNKAVIGNFEFNAIGVSHDAADPVAYVIRSGKAKISVISDVGYVSEELIEAARHSDIIAIEANHDMDMLLTGRYDERLKRRISGNQGHISNLQSAEALSRICKPSTRIILTHLSRENNRPDLALNSVSGMLKEKSVSYGSIECASQTDGSSTYIIDNDSLLSSVQRK